MVATSSPTTVVAPTTSTTMTEALQLADRHRVAAVTHRRLPHAEYWRAVQPLLASPRFTVAQVGTSMQGRALRSITFGRGSTTVLLWSQMHGDEATATMALADIVAWLGSPGDDPRRQRLDVVVTNTATASAIVRAAALPVPVVYFCHGLHWGNEQDGGATVWRSLERLLLRRTDGVITLNRDDEAWFRQRTDRPVHRLPYGVGVPLEEFPAAPVPAGPLTLLWAGDFSARKRPESGASLARMSRAVRPATFRMTAPGRLFSKRGSASSGPTARAR
jgi:hypothetical protein